MSLHQIPLTAFRSIKVPGSVTSKQSIKAFVESKKLKFEKGAGFYELSKPEVIQLNKRLLVQRVSDPSLLITGTSVTSVLGIDAKTAKKGKYMVEETVLQEFRIYVQSTSYNRNLIGGTTFLYLNPSDPDPFEAGAATDTVVIATSTSTAVKRANSAVTSPTTPKRGRRAAPAASPAATISTSAAATAAATSATATVAVTPAAPTTTGSFVTNGLVEIVISFDTTASMYPCLSQVRTVVKELLRQLTDSIPTIRIGILAHGDYESHYVTKAANDYKLCDASRVNELIDFVTQVDKTVNYSFDECYEFVLHEVGNKFDWTPGAQKSLIMIGDSTPHEPHDNPHKLDWRVEAAELKEKGIRIYAVHAMDYHDCDLFYRELAQISMGFYLRLHQFSNIADFLKAVCFREGDSAEGTGTNARLTEFEDTVRSSGRMVNNLRQLFDQLQGRAPAVPERAVAPVANSLGLIPVSPTRFQVLTIDRNQAIKEFALARGLAFKVGRGFYEFTKPEAISDRKEVVLLDKTTGDFFTGWEAARSLAGIDSGEKKKQAPKPNSDYVVFIQSSSYNRTLIAGQQFLYEVDTDTI